MARLSTWHRFHSPARPQGRLIAQLCREINAEHAAREAAHQTPPAPAPAAASTPDDPFERPMLNPDAPQE